MAEDGSPMVIHLCTPKILEFFSWTYCQISLDLNKRKIMPLVDWYIFSMAVTTFSIVRKIFATVVSGNFRNSGTTFVQSFDIKLIWGSFLELFDFLLIDFELFLQLNNFFLEFWDKELIILFLFLGDLFNFFEIILFLDL